VRRAEATDEPLQGFAGELTLLLGQPAGIAHRARRQSALREENVAEFFGRERAAHRFTCGTEWAQPDQPIVPEAFHVPHLLAWQVFRLASVRDPEEHRALGYLQLSVATGLPHRTHIARAQRVERQDSLRAFGTLDEGIAVAVLREVERQCFAEFDIGHVGVR
jgi:hypothetical protein